MSHNAPLCVSADGTLLAVGSHDNFIYLYTVSERGRKYSRYGKCTVRLCFQSLCLSYMFHTCRSHLDTCGHHALTGNTCEYKQHMCL